MDDSKVLRGIELRYALTLYLAQHGPKTITELIDGLSYHGFLVAGDPPKSISDALRWEQGHGRVLRLRRGTYGPLDMPRSTEHRIRKRVLELRAQARSVEWF